MAVTDTLPAGLSMITETLSADVGYDPASRVATWPARLLWAGEHVRYSFQARAAVDLGLTALVNQATVHGFWPNTASLPVEQRQVFADHERTAVVSTSVTVNPNLAADADATGPWVSLAVLSPDPQVAEGAQAPLRIEAAPDARRMYLREWTPDPVSGAWTVADESGWISYSSVYTWTLSARQGVRYLGVWVTDGVGNVSVLDEYSLAMVNRMDSSQALAAGERAQHRGYLDQGTWIIAYLTTVSGDPDVYVWRPLNAFYPDRFSNDPVAPGEIETAGEEIVQRGGLYLLDVVAVGDSEYRLATTAEQQAADRSRVRPAEAKQRPTHPLTVSDPLSAGRVEAPRLLPARIYLPTIMCPR